MVKKRLIQYSLFWLYTAFSLLLPCILLLETYGVYKDPSAKKFTFCFIFVVFLLIFYFRKHVSKLIDSLTPCMLKSILIATREMIPLILLFGAFYGCCYLIETQALKALFVVKWTCIFNCIGYGIRIAHLRYSDKVKEDYQVDLVKKALK